VAYQISYRQLDEMMEERGVEVDHSTLNRWVVKYAPLLERQFRARKRPVGASWRLDETPHGGLRVKEFKSLIHA
jgi:putative transposase